MLKFLLIAILVIYSFYRVASFLFKIVFGGYSKGQFNSQQRGRKAPNSNLNVDRIPRNENRKKDFEGGDYVDFEEVK
ncbi:MAG: hypothetical protein RIM99_05050 [Cyclobacteriaceae bacterium]